MRFIVVIILLFSLTMAKADDGKRNSFGVGTYSTIVDYESESTIRLHGLALIYTFSFTNWIAVHAEGYSQEDDGVDVHGVDISMLLGHNLLNNGFRIYFKAGRFLEKMDSGPFGNEVNSGTLLGLGIGWTWTRVDLNFWMAWREPNAYEHGGEDVNAISSGLSIAFRF